MLQDNPSYILNSYAIGYEITKERVNLGIIASCSSKLVIYAFSLSHCPFYHPSPLAWYRSHTHDEDTDPTPPLPSPSLTKYESIKIINFPTPHLSRNVSLYGFFGFPPLLKRKQERIAFQVGESFRTLMF